MSDAPSQVAARTAAKDSMPGVTLDQVIISSVEDVARRRLTAAEGIRKLSGTNIYINFTVTVTTEQFNTDASGANALYTTLAGQMEDAVTNGDFNTYLATAISNLGATSLGSATAVLPVTSSLTSIDTTPEDVSDSVDNGDTDLIAGLVAGILCVALVLSGLAWMEMKRRKRVMMNTKRGDDLLNGSPQSDDVAVVTVGDGSSTNLGTDTGDVRLDIGGVKKISSVGLFSTNSNVPVVSSSLTRMQDATETAL